MRDTIAWSSDLPHAEEQAALPSPRGLRRRLDPGGGRGGLALPMMTPHYGVLEGVASLADKSLMREDDGSGGEPRYLMLETVREYAFEQWQASGEEAARSGCATPPGVWPSPSRRHHYSADRARARGSRGWSASTATSGPGWRGSRRVARSRLFCGWRRPSATSGASAATGPRATPGWSALWPPTRVPRSRDWKR